MVVVGYLGNLFIFNILIGVFLKEGNVGGCLEYWISIIDFGIVLDLYIYSIMIDGFCKL